MTFIKGQLQPCQFQKGNIPWIKGKHHTIATKKKISESQKGFKPWRHIVAGWNKGKKGVQVSWRKGKKYPEITGEKNPNWKGDKVGKYALHTWVARKLGKPNTCEFCKKTGLKGHDIHWASKSGKYKRDLTDWIRLCVPCHKKHDVVRLKKLKNKS